jgi:hypothetical protein
MRNYALIEPASLPSVLSAEREVRGGQEYIGHESVSFSYALVLTGVFPFYRKKKNKGQAPQDAGGMMRGC